MDTIESIHRRKSIRTYKKKELFDELIGRILSARIGFPSACSEQPWHFVVITDKNILKEISELNPYEQMAKEADFAILVCGDLSVEKHKGLCIEDYSEATQNILVTAHEMGLGAVLTGIYSMQERAEGFQNLLNIPNNIIPLAFIPVVFPEEPSRENRFKEDRIHYNKW